MLPEAPEAVGGTAPGEAGERPAQGPSDPCLRGLTLTEFAQYAHVDRRTLARSLREIPPGPVPPLNNGDVPVRRIGKTRRIFLADFLGTTHHQMGGPNDHDPQEATPDPDAGTRWHRQMSDLRRRAAP